MDRKKDSKMPNFCENRMMVFGDKDNVEKFFKDCEKDSNHSEFDLNKMLPLTGEHSGNAIVDAQYDQWGTKWGPCEVQMGTIQEWNGSYQLGIDYETAWGPALVGLSKLSAKYQLRFELNYFEPGMMFGGKYSVDNGIEKLHIAYEGNELISYAKENDFFIAEDEELEDSEVEKGG